MSGLDLLFILNERNIQVPVNFTTTYDNFMLEALRPSAMDYLINENVHTKNYPSDIYRKLGKTWNIQVEGQGTHPDQDLQGTGVEVRLD